MPEVVLEFNALQLQKVLDGLREAGKDCGLQLRHLVWEQAADACTDLVKHTAPVVDGGGSFAAQRRVGEDAVEGDILALFGAADAQDATWEWNNRRFVRFGGAARKVLEITDRWKPDVGDVGDSHRARRRFGSSSASARRGKKDWTRQKSLKRYVRDEKKHVGMLKAGWLAALSKYAGKVGKSVKIPNWISRHDTPCRISDTLTELGDGEITIQNQAKHNATISNSLLHWVMNQREKDAKKWLAIRAEKIAKRISEASA